MPKKRTSRYQERHQARSVAVQVLYSLSFTEAKNPEEALDAYQLSTSSWPNEDAAAIPTDFAKELVLGVFTNLSQIDAIISKYSQHWRIERIGHIELNLLRLAMYELFFNKDTPPKVVINEALELSMSFGVWQSKKFINGILDAAIRDLDKQSPGAN